MRQYQNIKTNKNVIEKKLPLTEGLNAVRVYKNLNVASVPYLMDYDIFDTHLSMKLSYIEGKTLLDFSKTEGWLLAIDILIKNAFLSLWEIHQSGYLHRDIKPENILVGKNLQVYFIDLDYAVLKTELKTDLSFVGTLKYMAPETLYSPLEVDESSDYFSLACCFMDLLQPHAKELPFKLLDYLCEMMAYSKFERPKELMNWLKKI